MARAIWSGTISFGLVNVPVKAFTATRDHNVHFHELDEKGSRVKHVKVSAKTGKPVDDIRLGFETSKGHYVRFTPEEIDELRPESTRSVTITDFVDLNEIDPIFYDRTYWLGPADKDAAPAYALLRDAMEDEERVGIGTVVMRRSQHLAAIRPIDGALAMSTMRFADEVVPSSSIDGIPKRGSGKGSQKERALARQIIDAFASDWDPERYHDTYTEELRALIKKKAKGEEITVEEPPESTAEVVDLMEALQRSVDEARKHRKGSASRSRSRSRSRKSA
jgi:DNA end-binding protein Ku